ncbi:hypothetical protein Hte_001712 [Hypoxylon texense]
MASNDLVWGEGDIAFLKGLDQLTDSERGALTGLVADKATGHPVIILEYNTGSKYCLITTVSAYSSGPHNGFLPPWNQPWHKSKARAAFFAFAGSEKPDARQKHLELEGSGRWPKPKTSSRARPFESSAGELDYGWLRRAINISSPRWRKTPSSPIAGPIPGSLRTPAPVPLQVLRPPRRRPTGEMVGKPAEVEGDRASHLNNQWPLSNDLKLGPPGSFRDKSSAHQRTGTSTGAPASGLPVMPGDSHCLRHSLGPSRLGSVSRSQGLSTAGTATREDHDGQSRHGEGWVGGGDIGGDLDKFSIRAHHLV